MTLFNVGGRILNMDLMASAHWIDDGISRKLILTMAIPSPTLSVTKNPMTITVEGEEAISLWEEMIKST